MEQKNIVFIISAPRSGSTMLQRILNSHTEIMAPPEPHILTPLAHLGYYYKVDQAGFNVNQAAKAIRDFVGNLPGGEEDYLDACRAYSNTFYERMLSTTGKRIFVDKTPDYGWKILPFIKKLYPEAKYIVLTRHPVAILSSQAAFLYSGDFDKAIYYRNVVEMYVPPIVKFMQESDVAKYHVRYEDIVHDTKRYLGKIFEFLKVKVEESAINYGNKDHISGLGDTKIDQYTQPVTVSVDKWAAELAGDRHKLRVAKKVISKLESRDLETWGYEKDKMFAEVFKSGIIPLKSANKLPFVVSINYMVMCRVKEMTHKMRFQKMVLRLESFLHRLSR